MDIGIWRQHRSCGKIKYEGVMQHLRSFALSTLLYERGQLRLALRNLKHTTITCQELSAIMDYFNVSVNSVSGRAEQSFQLQQGGFIHVCRIAIHVRRFYITWSCTGHSSRIWEYNLDMLSLVDNGDVFSTEASHSFGEE